MPKFKYFTFIIFVSFLVVFGPPVSASWNQDGGNEERTGYTNEEPLTPWTYLWSFNGPDSTGKSTNHFFDAGRSDTLSILWEGRSVIGGNYIYVPALNKGVYALDKNTGITKWIYNNGDTFVSTPAYYTPSNLLIVGGKNGYLYKINAQTGELVSTYNAASPILKSVLIVNNFAVIVTQNGNLHKVNIDTMQSSFIYQAGAQSSTPASYAASNSTVFYATKDLYIHGVSFINGTQKFKVKPSTLQPGTHTTFEGYYPVVANNEGVVFFRMSVGGDPNDLFSGPLTGGKWPTTNDQIKTYLNANPKYKNLFALDINTGAEKFIPAVGNGGTEGLYNGSAMLSPGPPPVVKTLPNGSQVAYVHFRNGQTKDSNWDGRWDSHLGEMVLNNNTVAGLTAGDIRFVQFDNSYVHITDEQNVLTMGGNTVFHSHWGALESSKITDRSNNLGINLTSPIKSSTNPVIIRRQTTCSNVNYLTHYTTCGLSLLNDGRYWNGPGYFTYWGVMDPPTPVRGAYSEGILPRYAYVSDGLLVVSGNGGEIMVFKHSGSTVTPTPTITPTITPTTTPNTSDFDNNGILNINDVLLLIKKIFDSTFQFVNPNAIADINGDGKVDLIDVIMLIEDILL